MLIIHGNGWNSVVTDDAYVRRPWDGRIYCDMDGVLADFDQGYLNAFGERLPPRNVRNGRNDDKMWRNIRTKPDFFRTLPLMPDALELWNYLKPLNATILTGVPKQIDSSSNDKIDWARANIPGNPKIFCCSAADKYLHCGPADVLIDDWEKYRTEWQQAGGIWVTHTSASATIRQLRVLGWVVVY